MSFSFSARASTAAEVKALVATKLDEVVAAQPTHERDRAAAEAAAGALVDVLAPEDGQEISVSVSGSLGWRGSQDEPQFTSANISVSASVVAE